ncbi:MAG: glycogen synthase GlgA [Firmicutes bacterium]|nr:glycogen synthase GlgA [Bacillota bacterium]
MTVQELDETYRILVASPEVAPFAKTGGLADVAGSLPKALAVMGNDVRVVMPRYRGITDVRTVGDFPVWVGWRKVTAILREGVIRARLNGAEKLVPVYFIDNYHYFDRDNMYMYFDEAERFAFFSRAILEMIRHLGWAPHIIHCNDWQTGPVPLLLREQYSRDPFYQGTASVFTIHNLQYQGNYPRETLHLLGLGDEYFTPERIEFYGDVSFMKAGILYADVINTVSKTYAKEIQTPEYGQRMDGVLRARSKDLHGILNGLNYHEFNPETDARIYRNYGLGNIEDKKENKYALQRDMNLPSSTAPLLGVVSRLVDQKGLDLIADAMDEMMGMDLQFVLLGTGDPYYENLFRSLRQRYPDKIAVEIGFNVVLAQRIYAGCDMFLMPSRFEPGGLGQLIAMRYGTIPIVRSTGGLADTVTNYEPERQVGNGFTFAEYSSDALLDTIRRAMDVYRDKRRWTALVENVMRHDFSWNRSAAEYMGLYGIARNKLEAVPVPA